MEIRLLGPIDITAGGRTWSVGPPQRQTVLAVLAAAPRTHIPSDTLVDRVWGEAPAPAARRALQAHVSRLRGLLAEASAAAGGNIRLVRRSDGYLLDSPPEAIDIHQFRQLVDHARTPVTSRSEHLAALRAALAKLRGEPLAGLTGRWAVQTREAWRREHLDVVCRWAEAELSHANHAPVIRHLSELNVAFPLVEPLVVILVRALSAAGYTGQALALCMETTRRLVAELGIEPGEELRELHRTLLG